MFDELIGRGESKPLSYSLCPYSQGPARNWSVDITGQSCGLRMHVLLSSLLFTCPVLLGNGILRHLHRIICVQIFQYFELIATQKIISTKKRLCP